MPEPHTHKADGSLGYPPDIATPSGIEPILAPVFTPSTTYKAAQLVWQAGGLYRAKADFTSAGSFSAGDWDAASGGSTPGGLVVRKFPFAFDTAGLLTGHAVYTPTIGDVLLDGWLEVDTAWDGTTPLFDIFSGASTRGWFGDNFAPLVLSGTNAADRQILDGLLSQTHVSGQAPSDLAISNNLAAPGAFATITRNFPAKFATADPIKVVVSTDGTPSGADPGATQGAAVLYLVTATPA